ncbi:MAG: hypothetical protein ACXWV8_05245 [Chitinophagaceae bacterium]
MESNYSNKDFEQYVKQNADQYRMFPSDKVWKGVNDALHTRRKWYGFWLGFLLLMTGGAVTLVMTTYPSSKKENSITHNNDPIFTPSAKEASAGIIQGDLKNLLPFNKEIGVVKNSFTIEGNNSVGLPLPKQENITGETLDLLPVSQQYHVAETERFSEVAGSRINTNRSILNNLTGLKPAIIDKAPFTQLPSVITRNSTTTNNHTEFYSLLTIESITNAYQYKNPPKKISWQLFVTPTVSYRKLSVNNSLDNSGSFNYPFASLTDVNNAVTHKPDLGLQIGVSGRYPIAKNLKVRGGLQFNINRYDIKAYAFNGEVATIDLNDGSGTSSISTWTHYRNFAGYKSNWLKNYYFSVSAPIGVEVKLIGNNKTNLGIAGTLQPTYILKDRAYLISTDYKNYAEVPRLVRHVNLNTSFETFVNYTSGKTKWQIGPQVRYQILSSFHNKYPVKENLFDFGVKLGVTLNE